MSTDKSLMQQIAELPPEEQAKALEGLDPEQLLWDWTAWRRPSQVVPPPEESSMHVLLAGRGAGKTRSAAETVREWARKPNTRIFLVARTAADTRDVMIEGESGLMNIHPPSEQPLYEPSKRRVTWPNGSMATAFSSETPDALRGPQAEFSWLDELGAWSWAVGVDGLTAYDNVKIATRLGSHPQILVTTTPKRVPAIKQILKDADDPTKRITISRGKTADNAGNLSASYLDTVYGLYAGTRLGAQELEGILLDDQEGALWSEGLIEDSRVPKFNGLELPLRVIGVDPSVSATPKDECGIVAVGATRQKKFMDRHAYVLEDASILGSPEVWARQVIECARRWRAPIVAEQNQGGELVRLALQQIDPTVPVYLVHSKQGKDLRAEPIVLAYERGQVHHVGYHAMLEAQMTSWVPEETRKSPDRCLVSDTLISMGDGGQKKISDVAVGDYVLTRAGARRVVAAEMTAVSAEVSTIRLTDGSSLTGTGSHPVWVEEENAFVSLDALVPGKMTLWKTTSRLKSSLTVSSSSEALTQTSAITESTTALRGELSERTFFTELSTRPLADPSQADFISTTSTRTRSTTRSATLSHSLRLSTGKLMMNTGSNADGTSETSFIQPPLSGMAQRQAGSFTRSSESYHGREELRPNETAAIQTAATKPSHVTRLTAGYFVLPNAGERTTERTLDLRRRAQLMAARLRSLLHTKKSSTALGSAADLQADRARADSASLRSYRSRASTAANPSLDGGDGAIAVNHARFGIREVSKSGVREVWNIAVEGENEYYANGILVHNCDALVHGITALISAPPKNMRAALGGGGARFHAARGQLPGVKNYGVPGLR